VIVVDASAAISALFNAGPARQSLTGEQLHVPHLIDAEVASGLRASVTLRLVDADAGWTALSAFGRLAMTRYPTFTLFDRVWELRDSLSAYEATYVALAERLGCNLVTADGRLSRAPGLRCSITVVPR